MIAMSSLSKKLIATTALSSCIALVPLAAEADLHNPPMAPDANNASQPSAVQNLDVGKFISPEMCGAKGDDTTDDTAAIIGMFAVVGGGTSAACPNFGSGGSWTVKLFHKIYKVTGQILVDIGTFTNNLQSDGLKIIAADAGSDIDGQTIPNVTIASGSYNSGTGAVNLTVSASHNIPVGGIFNIQGAAGTGSFASLNGEWVATAGTTGTTLNFTAATSLTLTVTGGNVGSPTLAVTCSGVANGCNNLVLGQGGRVTVKGSNNYGKVFVLDRPDLTDKFLISVIDKLVPQNFSTNANASGAEINNVALSRLAIEGTTVGTGGGANGAGLVLNQLQGSTLEYHGGWPNGIGLDLEGTVTGNTIVGKFSGATALKIGNASVQHNTFVNPDLSSSTTGINASAGSANLVLNPYFGADNPFYASGTPVGLAEIDSVVPYGQITSTGTVSANLPDPLPYAEYDVIIVNGITSLTLGMPRCNAGSDGKKVHVGTAATVSAITWNTQTAGNTAGAPSSLSAAAFGLKCRGGEGTWRPI